MKKIVLDSSVIVKWLNKDDEARLSQADKILSDTQNGKVDLLACELSKYEVGNALLKKGLSQTQTLASLVTLYVLPISFYHETEKMMRTSVCFAKEFGVTYYDASPAALAKEHKAVLITDNLKHQGRIKGVKVLALADYS